MRASTTATVLSSEALFVGANEEYGRVRESSPRPPPADAEAAEAADAAAAFIDATAARAWYGELNGDA